MFGVLSLVTVTGLLSLVQGDYYEGSCNYAISNGFPMASGYCTAFDDGYDRYSMMAVCVSTDMAYVFTYSGYGCYGNLTNLTITTDVKCDVNDTCYDNDIINVVGIENNETDCSGLGWGNSQVWEAPRMVDACVYWNFTFDVLNVTYSIDYWWQVYLTSDEYYLLLWNDTNCSGSAAVVNYVYDGACMNDTYWYFSNYSSGSNSGGDSYLDGECNYGIVGGYPIAAGTCNYYYNFEYDFGSSFYVLCFGDYAYLLEWDNSDCYGNTTNVTMLDYYLCGNNYTDMCSYDETTSLYQSGWNETDCEGDLNEVSQYYFPDYTYACLYNWFNLGFYTMIEVYYDSLEITIWNGSDCYYGSSWTYLYLYDSECNGTNEYYFDDNYYYNFTYTTMYPIDNYTTMYPTYDTLWGSCNFGLVDWYPIAAGQCNGYRDIYGNNLSVAVLCVYGNTVGMLYEWNDNAYCNGEPSNFTYLDYYMCSNYTQCNDTDDFSFLLEYGLNTSDCDDDNTGIVSAAYMTFPNYVYSCVYNLFDWDYGYTLIYVEYDFFGLAWFDSYYGGCYGNATILFVVDESECDDNGTYYMMVSANYTDVDTTYYPMSTETTYYPYTSTDTASMESSESGSNNETSSGSASVSGETTSQPMEGGNYTTTASGGSDDDAAVSLLILTKNNNLFKGTLLLSFILYVIF